MKEKISVGAIVQSLAGRDKDGYFLVVKVQDEYAYIVDGRTRKVSAPKRKNLKHLIKVTSVSEKLIEQIKSGTPIGNERLYRVVKNQIEKIGG